jgi:hypothetical protein
MYDKQYRVMLTFEERADEIVFLQKNTSPHICCDMELVMVNHGRQLLSTKFADIFTKKSKSIDVPKCSKKI